MGDYKGVLMAFDFWSAFNGVLVAMVDNPFYLIFLLIGALMIPFSLLGTVYLYSWLNTWQKLRSGWIKVRKKLSNGRWVEFWARPTGRKIKVKGEEGMEFEVPVQIEKNMMAYESELGGKWIKSQDFVAEVEKRMAEIESKTEELEDLRAKNKKKSISFPKSIGELDVSKLTEEEKFSLMRRLVK